jgi:hypothetical protein
VIGGGKSPECEERKEDMSNGVKESCDVAPVLLVPRWDQGVPAFDRTGGFLRLD